MKFRILSSLLLCSLGLCVSAAFAEEKKLERFHYSEPHLGTVVQLIFYAEDEADAKSLAQKCFARVRVLDGVMSDYKADSELSQLCRSEIEIPHKVSPELFEVLSIAQQIFCKSEGALDVTVGNLTQQWRSKSQSSVEKITPPDFRSVVLNKEAQTVTLRQALKIDLGGVGKGFIADQLMVLVKQTGVTSAAISIGGETLLSNAPPAKKGWKIGVEDSERKLVGSLMLENVAVSTSGDSYQFVERDGQRNAHLIDPATQRSKQDRLNVVTVAPTTAQADAWATALRVLPLDKALTIAEQNTDVEALFLPHSGEPFKTPNFPKLYIKKQ